MKLKPKAQQKLVFSNTLKGWFPILMANISDLEKSVGEYSDHNPFVEIKSRFTSDFSSSFAKKTYSPNRISNSNADKIESLTLSRSSVYEELFEQITPPLFPTQISQEIAKEIVLNLSENGYFEGDIAEIALKFEKSEEEIEKIRLRFAYLNPIGVGAKDAIESFLFQLDDLDIENELYLATRHVILSLQASQECKTHPLYKEAIEIIKKFTNPPFIGSNEDIDQIIPDLYIFRGDAGIEVKLNDAFYPEIFIEESHEMSSLDFVRIKIKEARNLVDAMEMRKATIYKIGLMIVEYQYDYFHGGKLKPMRLQDIADEFGHNSSTISRAIANKYISCDKGVIPMKEFFSTALDDEISNNSIKEFINNLIKNENREKPLSDTTLVEMVEQEFKITIGRRTINKYRLQLGIESSSDRKKAYALI